MWKKIKKKKKKPELSKLELLIINLQLTKEFKSFGENKDSNNIFISIS